MANLARNYSNLGQYNEAAELFSSAISTAERTLGDQHPSTQLLRTNFKDMQTKKDT